MTSEIIQVIAPKSDKRAKEVYAKLRHIASEEKRSVSSMAWKLLSDAVLKYSPIDWNYTR